MRILGIETSCDETAAGVVDGWSVRSNVLHTHAAHQAFGGVVPEIASREHLRLLPGIVRQALQESGLALDDLDGIAFTRGPGLAGPLLVGASFAQAMGMESGLPVWGVNHLEGHLAAVRLGFPQMRPPFLALTVSGGHTELTAIGPNGEFETLGATRDDAVGEAFDKCGKLLGLGYPAGPLVSGCAQNGNRQAFALPRGLANDGSLDFSFSGLKSAVARVVSGLGEQWSVRRDDVCASLEEALVDILAKKTLTALEQTGLPGVAVCGGVSANRRLRDVLTQRVEDKGRWAKFPPPALCTDNGVMIAGAALWRLELGQGERLVLDVDPRLSLG